MLRCLPSDIKLAPDSLNSLHPICIENAFSIGSVLFPLVYSAASPVRNIPGVRLELLKPFRTDDASDGCLLEMAVASGVKVSRSDLALSDALGASEPSSLVSSPAHIFW